jgi:hypothetical protein
MQLVNARVGEVQREANQLRTTLMLSTIQEVEYEVEDISDVVVSIHPS